MHPRPLVMFKGPTSKGRDGKQKAGDGGGEGKGFRREREENGREGGKVMELEREGPEEKV